MGETIEKIYCTEPGGNNNLLLASMLGNGGGFGGGQWNNPFIYLVWMMFANRYFGNGAFDSSNTAIQDQLAAFRNQMADNQNSNQILNAISGTNSDIRSLANTMGCDFNALTGAINDVRACVDRVAGQVGFSAERVINAANLGDANIISALKDCCCQTKTLIQQMGFDGQLATERQTYTLGSKMDQISAANALQNCQNVGTVVSRLDRVENTVQNGLSTLGYQASRDTDSIITAINASQQKTADLLCNHWSGELSRSLQDAKFEISQLKQNQYISNLLRNGNGNCGCSYGITCN
jgi:hypothetical protein